MLPTVMLTVKFWFGMIGFGATLAETMIRSIVGTGEGVAVMPGVGVRRRRRRPGRCADRR